MSQFNKECDDLVGATLVRALFHYLSLTHSLTLSLFCQRLSWADQEQEVVDLYIDYLSDLLSAQTYYLKAVLNMLVLQLFKPGKIKRQAELLVNG